MKISPGQTQPEPVEPPSTPAAQVKTARTSTPTAAAAETAAEKTKGTESTATVTPLERPTDITYRRDNNGRVYYSISDAKSGEEILEVPPKALRDVSQGIEDYVKGEQSKATAHVKVKA